MFEETYCGRRVLHVYTCGDLQVYSIMNYRTMGCLKYAIFHKIGLFLKNVHTKREAIRCVKREVTL